MSPEPRPTSIPSGILLHPAVWPQQTWVKIGGAVPLFGGAGSQANTKSPGPRPTSISSGILIHPAIWPQRSWAENWGLCPLFLGGGELGTDLTQCGRSQDLPSFILIRPTIWPQYTNVTDREDSTDRQRSDRIGQTTLQTVAQKAEVVCTWIFGVLTFTR